MLSYNLQDVNLAIPSAYLSRGSAYEHQGRVAGLGISADGSMMTALVRGGGKRPYKVIIHIAGQAGSARIRGNCSCPMGNNCKHVAAVLLHALHQKPSTPSPATPAPSATHTQKIVAPKGSGSDTQINDWLTRIEQAIAPKSEPPPEIPERLLYLLSMLEHFQPPRLEVKLIAARLLKAGGYGKAKNLPSTVATSPPRYATPADTAILRWLHVLNPFFSHNTYRLEGADGERLLRDMLATGRCHWRVEADASLALGEPRHGHIDWVMSADGTQRPHIAGVEGVDAVLPLTPPWYLDLNSHQCGPLRTDLPDAVAAALLGAPAVAPEQALAAREALKQRIPGLPPTLLPQTFAKVKRKAVKPVPCLLLLMQALEVRRQFQWQLEAAYLNVELARLSFDYAGEIIPLGDKRTAVTRVENGELLSLVRDEKTEKKALQRLKETGFEPINAVPIFNVPPAHAFDMTMSADDDRQAALLDFSMNGVPVLRKLGWRVEFAPDYSYRPVDDVGDWYADVEEGAGNDWFGLELGIMVDGKPLNLLPVLINMLHQFPDAMDLGALQNVPANQSFIARLEDGRFLPLPIERIRNVLGTLIELYNKDLDKNGRLILPAAQAGQLAELESLAGKNMEWQGGERLRELGHRLRDFKGIAEADLPTGLNAELRPYQKQGLNWLQFLRDYGLAGILADDMGLGKTVQTLAHLLLEKESGRMDRPSLVIAPTSLMVNWRIEAERFAPSLKVLVLQGLERKQHFERLAGFDVVLTTYPLLPRDQEVLLAQEYHLVILDEAQVIKNPKAKASQIVRQLKTRHRLCLTGTPMENHLGEMWSLLDFLMPGLLGNEKQFGKAFRTPIEKHGDATRRDILRRRIAPFMLRRTKQEVVKELPPKSEILRNVELAGTQRDLYESIRLAMHTKVRDEINKKGMARSQIIILDALLKLRQVCCDPRLVKLDSAKKVKHSAKLELLMEMLPEMVEEGRRILLFSQFTGMLALIEEELKQRKLDYVQLTGNTRDRATPVQRFQAGEVPLFLISLKAGGTGLNLTAADTVIHYDPWWNPAVENQATDRAHRIGQDKAVFVYKLITSGTVEEKILGLQARKKELADSLFDETAKSGPKLTLEDLNALFEPLG